MMATAAPPTHWMMRRCYPGLKREASGQQACVAETAHESEVLLITSTVADRGEASSSQNATPSARAEAIGCATLLCGAFAPIWRMQMAAVEAAGRAQHQFRHACHPADGHACLIYNSPPQQRTGGTTCGTFASARSADGDQREAVLTVAQPGCEVLLSVILAKDGLIRVIYTWKRLHAAHPVAAPARLQDAGRQARQKKIPQIFKICCVATCHDLNPPYKLPTELHMKWTFVYEWRRRAPRCRRGYARFDPK